MIILIALLIWVVLVYTEAWLVMLCIGAAHSDNIAIPALGYWPIFWICLAVSILIGTGAQANWSHK